ncbi:non-structural maintenance of chromosomes element 3 homolog isoform X2 [Parasteatoda tepidariorum]|uniref:non-structural maintenance of chromosomes element 3 homolog isoform X2 n=1 Tax=Parasteatoda tepidariorum TaxID=114398 RepID=UPI001C72278B|nr:non-structural maintenance of chromosomes element 3 homolog isoform X2 [Parasteatoda tepidariorum]
MSSRNKARKSTGPRATSTPQLNSTNRTLRQRASTQVTNSSPTQGESSDSDEPTQRLRSKTQNSTIQSTPGPSGLSSRPSTSRAAADSNINDQSTLRLSNGRHRNSTSESDTTSDSDEAPGRIKATQEKNNPSKRRKITRKKNHSDSEEDFSPSPSSRTTLKSRNVSSSLNKSVSSNKSLQSRDMCSLVNKCVYYLLVADQKKYAIKQTDLQKHVFAGSGRNSYKETYGMELVKCEKRKGEFMLINVLKPDLGIQKFIDLSSSELQKRGLLFYLLTVIFMNEGSITDDELTNALKPLHIDLNARLLHPVFGDVRGYLTKELVKQNYLEHKCINKDPPQYEFCWGERAYQEVDKKDLLKFACLIIGDVQPEDWILQYSDATSREQGPA